MPTSKKRKKKTTKPKQSHTQARRQLPVKYSKTLWEKVRDHPIPWGMSVLASLIAVVATVWQAFFVEPDIEVSEMGANLPFEAPIKITNHSFLFAMRDTSIRCEVKMVRLTGNRRIEGIKFEFPQPKKTIEPNKSANFQCRIANATNDNLASGDIFVSAVYATLWKTRQSEGAEVTWFASSEPPRWINGAFPGLPR